MFTHTRHWSGRRAKSRLCIALALGALSIPISPVLGARHPLDPLSLKEFWKVYEVMKASGRLNETSRFLRVRLHEPPKSEVLSWKLHDSFRREAFVVIRQGPRILEAVLDLEAEKVITWTEREVAQLPRSGEELRAVEALVKNNPDWQAAMHRRGITDFDTVRAPYVGGWVYPTADDTKRERLVKVVSFDPRGTINYTARPIEGLVVIVDLNKLEVREVIDSGVVPIPKGPVDYDRQSVGKLREVPTPISISQPQGPSFQVDGHQVSWQKWNFHFRIDPRVGLVISNVGYQDGDKFRSVLYQGSLSEIYVPYMNPDDVGWNTRLYLDVAGGSTGFSGPLEPGLDCPNNAVFFDTVVAGERGIPRTVSRAACLFERYDGAFAWRHDNKWANHAESRSQRDLVLRMIAAIGNYDYAFDWVFQQNGTMKVAVGATGINNVKAVASRTALEDKEGLATRYGRFLAEYTVGVNHDHFFCFRLDLDVDGTSNSLLREELKTIEVTNGGQRKRVWVVKPKIARTENEAMLNVDLAKPSLWRVINPNVLGPLGYPVSYQIKPVGNALSLLAPEDYPQRRGAFTQYHLWVTPYRADERHVAGAYPMYYEDQGLPEWTKANRRIENTDIVAWYTMGFHHVVRAEDWPVMPTVWQEFQLRPFDFFERNPALDLP